MRVPVEEQGLPLNDMNLAGGLKVGRFDDIRKDHERDNPLRAAMQETGDSDRQGTRREEMIENILYDQRPEQTYEIIL